MADSSASGSRLLGPWFRRIAYERAADALEALWRYEYCRDSFVKILMSECELTESEANRIAEYVGTAIVAELRAKDV